VRYRLPIASAAPLFLLTGREELGLRVGGAVCEPAMSRLFGTRSTETLEGQRSTPQQALVSRRKSKSRLGSGKCVEILR